MKVTITIDTQEQYFPVRHIAQRLIEFAQMILDDVDVEDDLQRNWPATITQKDLQPLTHISAVFEPGEEEK